MVAKDALPRFYYSMQIETTKKNEKAREASSRELFYFIGSGKYHI